jgi:hypothetical protein
MFTEDGQDDWSAERRSSGPKGEAAHGAKLTASEVSEIRRSLSFGSTPSALAREFGVSITNICDIRKRRIWRHIP